GGPYLMLFWHKAEWQGVVMGSLTLLALIALSITRLRYHQTKMSPIAV
ncbi:MAG: MFS transporter, partial [Shewanella sp.]